MDVSARLCTVIWEVWEQWKVIDDINQKDDMIRPAWKVTDDINQKDDMIRPAH